MEEDARASLIRNNMVMLEEADTERSHSQEAAGAREVERTKQVRRTQNTNPVAPSVIGRASLTSLWASVQRYLESLSAPLEFFQL